jgi:molybdopterin-guanine dinucleotide biosynthesis protein A
VTGTAGAGPDAAIPGAAFDTVILAGGSAARMGGADKPGIAVGRTAMLVLVAQAAAAAGTTRLIVVGPPRAGAVGDALAELGAVVVREEPPGGGPVPALRRGLAETTAAWSLVLAADLPFLRGALLADLLARGRAAAAAGAVLTDDDGRPQWLAGGWQTGALRVALAAYPGNSLRGLLGPLAPVLVRAAAAGSGPPQWLDCDSPADVAAARRLVGPAE